MLAIPSYSIAEPSSSTGIRGWSILGGFYRLWRFRKATLNVRSNSRINIHSSSSVSCVWFNYWWACSFWKEREVLWRDVWKATHVMYCYSQSFCSLQLVCIQYRWHQRQGFVDSPYCNWQICSKISKSGRSCLVGVASSIGMKWWSCHVMSRCQPYV